MKCIETLAHVAVCYPLLLRIYSTNYEDSLAHLVTQTHGSLQEYKLAKKKKKNAL